jgi:hypothetical protein
MMLGTAISTAIVYLSQNVPLSVFLILPSQSINTNLQNRCQGPTPRRITPLKINHKISLELYHRRLGLKMHENNETNQNLMPWFASHSVRSVHRFGFRFSITS